MSLSGAQIANTTATAFDVGLRYYASGALYTTLTAANLATFTRHAAAPALLSGWTELTTVAFEGSVTHDWTDNAVTWATQLRGWSYDSALLAPGYAIACTYRITRSGYDSGWLLDWVGVIDANDRRDDYRKGAAWAVTVRSAEATLITTDAAYLVLGAENVAEDGASVSASSTLATPEAEAGTGEYVGTTVTLSPDYVVDDDMRTLWISQDPPNLTEEAVSTTDSSFIVDEVFAWPLAGYDAEDVWWLELLCPLGLDDLTDGLNYWFWARNADGDAVVYWPAQVTPNAGVGVGTGERLILCGRRARAEAYCGGFHSAAQVVELAGVRCFPAPTAQDGDGDWIWDYTTVKHFSLHATDGYILFGKSTSTNYDMIVWGNPTLPVYYTNNMGWTGGGFVPPAANSGYSIRRQAGNVDSDTALDWQYAAFPRPGAKWDADTPEWLKLELREHETLLSAAVSAGATTLPVSSAYGWPVTGTGIIEGDTFTYTADGNDLLLTAGIAGGHAEGAALYPTVSGVTQTGWLVNRVVLKRPPGLSNLATGRCYLSHNTDCGTPDLDDIGDVTWQGDYDWNAAYQNFSNQGDAESEVTFNVWPQTWARTVLVIYDAMSALERAKLNEIEVIIDPGWTADATTFASIYQVLYYLLAEAGNDALAGVLTIGYAEPWGLIGKLTTAISPLAGVMADIAGVHGCVLHWQLDGAPIIHSNPWWPGGAGMFDNQYTGGEVYASLYTLGDSSIRGELGWSASRPAVTGVAVTARDTSGNLLQRTVFPQGATGSAVQEVQGLTISSAAQAYSLAANLYWQANNTERVRVTLTGVGEWCEPLQIVTLGDYANQAAQYQYITERVTRSWGWQGKAKTWRCELALRKYF